MSAQFQIPKAEGLEGLDASKVEVMDDDEEVESI